MKLGLILNFWSVGSCKKNSNQNMLSLPRYGVVAKKEHEPNGFLHAGVFIVPLRKTKNFSF